MNDAHPASSHSPHPGSSGLLTSLATTGRNSRDHGLTCAECSLCGTCCADSLTSVTASPSPLLCSFHSGVSWGLQRLGNLCKFMLEEEEEPGSELHLPVRHHSWTTSCHHCSTTCHHPKSMPLSHSLSNVSKPSSGPVHRLLTSLLQLFSGSCS